MAKKEDRYKKKGDFGKLGTVKVAYGCPHEMNVPNVMLVKRSARIVHETMQAFMTAVNANVQEDVENEVAATKGENVSGVKIMVTLGKRQQVKVLLVICWMLLFSECFSWDSYHD